jgi:hypothetical protein
MSTIDTAGLPVDDVADDVDVSLLLVAPLVVSAFNGEPANLRAAAGDDDGLDFGDDRKWPAGNSDVSLLISLSSSARSSSSVFSAAGRGVAVGCVCISSN